MDDRMTKNAMELLSYTPLIFLLNSYWMLSNRQMFENVINSVNNSAQQMSSAHALSSIAGFDQATPMLLFGFAFIIITILRVGFYETLSKWGFVISSNTIEVDENLPNFFTAVKLSDCDWLVKENEYVKENYKFAFANESVV